MLTASRAEHVNAATTEYTTMKYIVAGTNGSHVLKRKRVRREQEIRFFKQSVLNMMSLQVKECCGIKMSCFPCCRF